MARANPLQSGATKTAIANNIAKLKREGYPQAQAVAIALREARAPGKRTPPPRKRNYSYPDIASVKKVLGAAYVGKLVNANYPRLAIDTAHKNFAAKGQWEKAAAVTALERYIAKAGQQAGKKDEKSYRRIAKKHSRANPSTSTSSDVRSPTKTSTSTYARTTGNITVTGGAGAGATTRVIVRRNPKRRGTSPEGYAYYAVYIAGGGVGSELVGEYTARSQTDAIKAAKSDVRKIEGDAAANTYTFRAVKGAVKHELRDSPPAFRGPRKPLSMGGSKRNNPTVREQSEMFQGKVTDKVATFKAANSAPSNLARVGKLAGLKLANRRAELKIPGAMVALDTRGKLWIVGNRAPLFNVKAKPGEGLDYGEIETIAYVTGKAHVDGGKVYEYVHKFGEDGGTRPRLIVDSDGMPLLKGGSYTVESAGIID